MGEGPGKLLTGGRRIRRIPGSAHNVLSNVADQVMHGASTSVIDPESLAAWMRAYHDALGDWARPVLAGIGIIRSPRTVDFLNRRAAGIRVPEAWRDELATSSDPEALAVARAAELVAAVREVPGVCGVHLTALGWYAGLPRLLDALAQTRLAPAEA